MKLNGESAKNIMTTFALPYVSYLLYALYLSIETIFNHPSFSPDTTFKGQLFRMLVLCAVLMVLMARSAQAEAASCSFQLPKWMRLPPSPFRTAHDPGNPIWTNGVVPVYFQNNFTDTVRKGRKNSLCIIYGFVLDS